MKQQHQEISKRNDTTNVRVLILTENKTTSQEFYMFQNFTNLIKIDLSYNKLSSFPTGFSFSNMKSLRTLFLHYNKFTSLKSLVPVSECKKLIYLTLFGNAVEQAKVRHFFVNEIQSLKLIDNKIVSLEERSQQINLRWTNQINLVSFPLLEQKNPKQIDEYLLNVTKQLTLVRQLYLKNNKLIAIQRWWKKYIRNKHKSWKIVQLSRLQQKQQKIITTIQQHKKMLNRLVTQKYQIHKSKEQIVQAYIKGNYEFWKKLKQLCQTRQVLMTRQYCKRYAYDYEQIKDFKLLKSFKDVSYDILGNKNNLNFYVYYHSKLIIKKIHTNTKQKRIISIFSDLLNRQRLQKKFKIDYDLLKQNQKKLNKMEQKYHLYVRPKLHVQQLFHIIKKQYYQWHKNIMDKYQVIQQYPFLITQLSRRPSAAVTIQRIWKGYKLRKHLNIKKKMKQMSAIYKIQKWVRKLKFIHRFKFLIQVNDYLKSQIKSNQIILQSYQIPAIEDYYNYIYKKNNLFCIPFQKQNFTIFQISQNSICNSEIKINFDSQRSPYQQIKYVNFKYKSKNEQIVNNNSILSILFFKPQNIQKINDKSKQYYKFTYRSIQQTLNRKFILALKTYRMANHQFIKSIKNIFNYSTNIVNVLQQIKLNKAVQLQYLNKQNNLKQHKLSKNQSFGSLNSDFSIIGNQINLKIKYYQNNVDKSCIMKIYQLDIDVHKNKQKTFDQLYYFRKKRNYSKRYNNQDLLESHKITRKIISLQGLNNTQSQRYRQKIITQPVKILNTDQSHSALQMYHDYSTDKFHSSSFNKMQSHDKFDKQVYSIFRQNLQTYKIKKFEESIEEINHKKTIIQDIKSSHQYKLTQIIKQKQIDLAKIRQNSLKQEQQIQQIITSARKQFQIQKVKQVMMVKQSLKKTKDQFQIQFLKKGVQNLKKNMRQFQKNRQLRKSQNILQQKLSNSKSIDSKSQIKQYSLTLKQNQKELKRKDFLKRNIEIYKSRQTSLKSDISQNQLKIINQTQVIKNKKPYIKRQQRQQLYFDRLTLQQKKKIKKKRLVHSIFPQQFYPLYQPETIGFGLPKLNNNK